VRLFEDVASRVDDPYLSHAVSLALRGRGATSPNPIVGCVIVADERIVGEGYHPMAGEPHAEVFALRDAGDAARGATAYVTLEPCAHHGKTPPCAEALIEAGISRVVIGMADPNAEASGGAARLREAGIEVEFAADPKPFAGLNEGWLKHLATGMPLVRAKIALSLDGHSTLDSGRPASITGASGAVVTRMLRAASDAVAVGSATVSTDDPALTVRDADGMLATRQPLRVVFFRDAVPPPTARVLNDEAAETLLLDTSEGLSAALASLGKRGVCELLVEPGPRLLAALHVEGLIDELVVVTAGGMAGCDSPHSFSGPADRRDATLLHRMRPVEAGIVGDVSVTVWRHAEDAPLA
jgi:diaminohydroxyphosphoribosylaminopyrimidine deaminase/5-amino-6-(5-phosphoribosylamino)uracil reductase